MTPTPREALAELEQRRKYRENDDFQEWWAVNQECPEHPLIVKNAAHAAWQERAARAALAAVQPPLAEEGKDALRMDWLDKQRDLLFDCYMQDGKITHILRQHWGAPLGHGPTPRAAIDAAIAAMKEPT